MEEFVNGQFEKILLTKHSKICKNLILVTLTKLLIEELNVNNKGTR